MSKREWRLRDDAGSVTAEFAVAMPAVVLVLGICVGVVVGASVQVRVQDAAGEAARLAARGDDAAVALSIAGNAASLDIWDAGELRCARVSAPVLVVGLDLGIRAEAASCALRDVGS